jgi:hypothetical protein
MTKMELFWTVLVAIVLILWLQIANNYSECRRMQWSRGYCAAFSVRAERLFYVRAE